MNTNVKKRWRNFDGNLDVTVSATIILSVLKMWTPEQWLYVGTNEPEFVVCCSQEKTKIIDCTIKFQCNTIIEMQLVDLLNILFILPASRVYISN